MSVYDQPGLYLRNPVGGVEDVASMRAAGFHWIALNLGDHANEEWELVRERASAASVTTLPWARLQTLAKRLTVSNEVAAERLADIGRSLYGNRVLFNAEKELDGNDPLRVAMETSSVGMDAALSTEPRLFDSLKDTPIVRRMVVQLQMFPQESNTAKDPRWCRAHAYSYGCARVDFMHGMHDLKPGAFAPLQSPYSVYTADDCGNSFKPWSPAPPDPLLIPFQGPLYPAGHPRHVAGKLPYTVRALKVAMHRAGFGEFPSGVPDPMYGPRLKEALRHLQTWKKITPSGNYGKATHDAVCSLMSAIPGGGHALTQSAAAWMLL